MAQPELQFELNQQEADRAWTALNKAQTIGIISHRHPDPDSIGSNLALRQSLLQLGKQVDSFCVHLPPKTCQSLQGSQNFCAHFDPNQYDILISVDCGSLGQVAFENLGPENFHGEFLNIDHHTSNNNFGTINIVNTQLSSTCEIVYLLHRYWNLPIDSQIATCLLFGLYYDTGSFMHSNVTPRVLNIASDLISKGASLETIINHLYRNFQLEKFHLWGDTLQKIKVTDQQTSVAVIHKNDLDAFQANAEDISGLIDYLSMVKGSEYATLISQDTPNVIKGSLRTRSNELNLSALAETMGGGGHRKASGFSFPGKIEKQVIWKITT